MDEERHFSSTQLGDLDQESYDKGGCAKSAIDAALQQLGHDSKKVYPLGDHVDKGIAADTREKFGPYFAFLDMIVKLTALQLHRYFPHQLVKETMRQFIDTGFEEVNKDIMTQEFLANYWTFKISSGQSALQSSERVWRLIQRASKMQLKNISFMFNFSPRTLTLDSLSKFSNGKKSSFVMAGGLHNKSSFMGINSWYVLAKLLNIN